MARFVITLLGICALCPDASFAQGQSVELDLELTTATSAPHVMNVLRGFEDEAIRKYVTDRRATHRREVLQALAGNLEERRWLKLFQQSPRDRAWWDALSTASPKQLDAFVRDLLPVKPHWDFSSALLVAELGDDEAIRLLEEAIAKRELQSSTNELEQTRMGVQDVLDCRKDVIAAIGEAAWREENLKFVCAQHLDFRPHADSAVVGEILRNMLFQFSPEFLQRQFRRTQMSQNGRDACALLLASQVKNKDWEQDAVKFIRAGQLRAKVVVRHLSRESLEAFLDIFSPEAKLSSYYTLKYEVLLALREKGNEASVEKLKALLEMELRTEDDRRNITLAIQNIQKRL